MIGVVTERFNDLFLILLFQTRWTGKIHDHKGIFPANFVELV